ncbi:MAG TPA: hypothetical protein VFJ16_09560 [Longimicrobium sp.]|nr:hypothetical protein [Longimicrobium sp.]
MSDEAPVRHPPEFRRLCDDVIEHFRVLAAAEPMERGRMIPAIRAALARIDEWIDEQDIGSTATFAREQGLLVNASSALESIDLDRGGPHVRRYVDRAIADIQQVAG